MTGRLGLWRYLRPIFFVLLFTLGGCATQSPPRDDAALGFDTLQRNGRFAAKTEQANRNPEAVQGGFSWQDTGERLTLELTNPFGSVLARVVVTRTGATLEKANGETFRAPTPDALIQEVLGQTIPVQGLRAWLRVQQQATREMRAVEQDTEGRIIAFSQNGWRVQLSRFDAIGPRLIALSRTERDRLVAVRLVID